MQGISGAVIGGHSEIEVYYVIDGVYKKNKISSGGQYISEARGFEYIKAGDTLPLKCFEIRQQPDKAFRISRQLGLSDEITNSSKETNKIFDILVVYDPHDTAPNLLIQAIQQHVNMKTKIVYVMLRNDTNNSLLQYLAENHLESLLVVTNAEVLRHCGMDISYGLSWEGTVSDLVWQACANNTLRAVAEKGKLIVRFAAEGALRFCGAESGDSVVFQFMPEVIEGDLFRSHEGYMHDTDSRFVMPILSAFADDEDLDAAALKGLENVYSYCNKGYMITADGISQTSEYDGNIGIQSVGLSLDLLNQRQGSVWSLLEGDGRPNLEELAKDVVLQGMKKLADVPSARFCRLVTVDRKEIERFRAIRNLMEEYLSTSNPERPLCIAVFGAPGSGKSFGVTQIAECIGKGMIAKLEYNLSQMRSKDELVEAFHRIRDLVLKGKTPLVFFDEFDSDMDGTALGWLKSFLAPMQDGEFTHNSGVHPIGKCIFIFAGGIFSTFEEFCTQQGNSGAKVRDFISRLRGYVDIQGPNPNPTAQQDNAFILRRAVLLRSLIERKLKAVRDDGTACIDKDIVKAMLRVPNYRHGVRSMEAIIDMSMVSGKQCWDKADLPPADQLAIHVDKDQFKSLLLVNNLLASYREVIAMAIHNNYLITLKSQPEENRKNNPNNCSWSELGEEFREDNRMQADDIVEKLLSINCSIEPAGMSLKDFEFTENEVEQLATDEHNRWMSNKLKKGWTFGIHKDIDKKASPYLLPWDKLSEEARSLDRDPIRNIPDLLKDAKLAIYRIK